MKHKILIWSKDKETNKKIRIEMHTELSRDQIENLALQQYKEDYFLDDDREYWAEIDETIH